MSICTPVHVQCIKMHEWTSVVRAFENFFLKKKKIRHRTFPIPGVVVTLRQKMSWVSGNLNLSELKQPSDSFKFNIDRKILFSDLIKLANRKTKKTEKLK